MTKTQTPAEKATADAVAAMDALRNLPGLQEVLEDLRKAQAATEAAEVWDTKTGRNVEGAMGYLRMALEAAGQTF